jgi:hypothetical protein
MVIRRKKKRNNIDVSLDVKLVLFLSNILEYLVLIGNCRI